MSLRDRIIESIKSGETSESDMLFRAYKDEILELKREGYSNPQIAKAVKQETNCPQAESTLSQALSRFLKNLRLVEEAESHPEEQAIPTAPNDPTAVPQDHAAPMSEQEAATETMHYNAQSGVGEVTAGMPTQPAQDATACQQPTQQAAPRRGRPSTAGQKPY